MSKKEDKDLPSIAFTPIGNYERIKDGQSIEKGKIAIHYSNSDLSIGFYVNGIIIPIFIPPIVILSHPDTLIFTSGWHGNDMMQIDEYYVRAKD